MFTYDPGFTSTASTESQITYIDGDQGVLLYRGYPIDELAEHGDFLETCYLLLYGELPTAAQKADFDYRVTRHTMVHDQMNRFFNGFRRDAHPMSVMVACVGALAAFYHDSTDINDPWQREVASIRMIAKMPTLAAMAFKYAIGQPFVYPKNDLEYSANFLRMCFSVPCEDYKVNAVLARALDRISGSAGRGAGAGPRSCGGAGPMRGADLTATLTMSFEDAVHGITTALQLTSEAACSVCHGTGAKPGTAPRVCPTCGGRGVTDENQGFFSFSTPCTACHGQGIIVDDPCPNCRGTGTERRPARSRSASPPAWPTASGSG